MTQRGGGGGGRYLPAPSCPDIDDEFFDTEEGQDGVSGSEIDDIGAVGARGARHRWDTGHHQERQMECMATHLHQQSMEEGARRSSSAGRVLASCACRATRY